MVEPPETSGACGKTVHVLLCSSKYTPMYVRQLQSCASTGCADVKVISLPILRKSSCLQRVSSSSVGTLEVHKNIFSHALSSEWMVHLLGNVCPAALFD